MAFCFCDYDDYFDECGELRNPPKIDLDNIPPETQSCSQCIHFTYDPSNMCNVNPTLCNRRCEFHQPVGIFSCNFTIKCITFERDYTKKQGYITKT